MNDYTTLINARNRALAADPSFETRALVQLFDRTAHELDGMHPNTLAKVVRIAEWYCSQPKTGEG